MFRIKGNPEINSFWLRFDVSQGVEAILSVLDKVENLAKETPPVDNSGSRFGNPAFRTFYDKVLEVRSYPGHRPYAC